jgi:hypothetical protein
MSNEKLNKRYMKTFMIAFMFIAATFLPILFLPLLALTLVVLLIAGPYITTHTTWFASKRDIENAMKH